MIQILGRASIADFSEFIRVFSTRGAAIRRKHGSKRARLFRVSTADNEVVLFFDWESQEAFQEFLSDPMVKETMRSSGTTAVPEFTYLEHVADFPA
jgi:heme-degrading monooxygenase HmoA